MAKPSKKAEPCLTPDEIERATRKLATDLAFCARRPVNIQLVGGRHIAYTYDTDQTKRTVQIVMNPSILAKVRNPERAIQIWRGIGFHELAHHMWPAGEQYKIAQKEGFRDLFNLIDDEQNERRGRAFDATWGACFQSVCAFIFPGKKQSTDKLNTGIVDGDKPAQEPRGRAADKSYARRWNLFAYHLRRHIPGCTDEIVAEALGMIPKRFMDLTKDELLELTRQIHEILARGINIATPDENAKPEEQEPEPEEDEDDKKDDPDADKPEPDDKSEDGKEEPQKEERDGWSMRKLFKSKWLFLPFGLALVAWFTLLLQGGTDFWFRAAVTLVAVIAIVGTFLYLRRAYIKALLASLKARRLPPSGAAPPQTPGPSKLKVLLVATVVIALLGAFVYWMLHLFPPALAGLAIGAVFIVFLSGLIRRNYVQARRKRENVGKLSIIGIALATIASAAILIFSLHEIGLNDLWVALAGAVLMTVMLVGTFFLAKDKSPAAEAAAKARAEEKERAKKWKPGLWKRSKHALGKLFSAAWERFKKPTGLVLGFFWKLIAGFFGAIWKCVVFLATKFWQGLTFVVSKTWKFLAAVVRRIRWKLNGPLRKAWKNPVTRVIMLALPLATLLVMLYAVIVKAGTYGWWVAAIVILLLLLLLLLGWIFRKKLVKFIVTEMFMPMPQLMDASMIPPLDMHTEWFNQIDHIVPVQADQEFWDKLLPQIYPLAQQLRPLLAKCGRASVDREDQPDGFDLIEEAELALVGESAIFVDDDSTPKASVHLEIALDCSGSMASPTVSLKPGEKFLLGKFFALVLEQAVINLPGVSAHFWGFTDHSIFDCGVPGEGRVSGLQCGGGNNDSAMLWHMGQSAAASGKDVKILLMLSDGQPSECSWLSLHNLVLQFEQEGMIPWNFALDVIGTPAFERFFTDLVGQSLDQAIVTMGETLAALAADGI
ncbi:MAG: hypothetical protein JSS86_11450 [Cyanobacteria bacterium SZAS LIN-2]|nr:hypothetical protein [Cyanobacteria bacterium SZAS LIN-2]